MKPIENKYEFLLLFDCENGNPNGDPDNGNLPRFDPQDGHGLVSDKSLKRAVRDFVQLIGHKILIQHATNLNRFILEAHEATGGFMTKPTKDKVDRAAQWMCQNFYDVRTFGAVMSTGANAGQVRGPVQISNARSLHPILPMTMSITRSAVAEKVGKGDSIAQYEQWEQAQPENELQTFGKKTLMPYGLYLAKGFISAFDAQATGFSEPDLRILCQALLSMFEHNRSSSRGVMATRKLLIFKHVGTDSVERQRIQEAMLGCAPASDLLDLGKILTIELKNPMRVPRQFSDYTLVINREALPAGVQMIDLASWNANAFNSPVWGIEPS